MVGDQKDTDRTITQLAQNINDLLKSVNDLTTRISALDTRIATLETWKTTGASKTGRFVSDDATTYTGKAITVANGLITTIA
ncbi:hypothetical protein D4R20_03210 [bacterium]|nr:MAG: hypothetical protein D4R20_03210 [bacterium]